MLSEAEESINRTFSECILVDVSTTFNMTKNNQKSLSCEIRQMRVLIET